MKHIEYPRYKNHHRRKAGCPDCPESTDMTNDEIVQAVLHEMHSNENDNGSPTPTGSASS
jgi:hypothetical protein